MGHKSQEQLLADLESVREKINGVESRYPVEGLALLESDEAVKVLIRSPLGLIYFRSVDEFLKNEEIDESSKQDTDLESAAAKVQVGNFYAHYKHPDEKRYEVIFLALSEADSFVYVTNPWPWELYGCDKLTTSPNKSK